MTIEERIQSELKRLSTDAPEIYVIVSKLSEKFDELIGKVKDHLSEISSEMSEYDKHDTSHSVSVQKNIEALLQAQHIGELTLLEAMVLRFCCYFHDAGMILPAFCKPLLEQVEADPKADPQYGLQEWLAGPGKDFEKLKGLFLLPGTRDRYRDFLIRELVAYRDTRLGLEPKPEGMAQEVYIRKTRHDYLRSKHGERVRTYALNLSRAFAEIIHGSEAELAKTIGEICAAHSWEIKDVHALSVKKELYANCPELSCNVRYLAMLLRLGDLLHFGPERASETLYLEREQMSLESDLHWRAKQGTRGYRISATPAGGVDIAYHGSFDVPREYYFVQSHTNWVDEELSCYENFRRQMELRKEERNYDLGLPERVNREHLDAQGFTPDRDFKFKLEHRNIIELLMGARLYRDEFMCLRELYQNALDACRCMRAERPGLEPEIEFGLGKDDSGDYLYCKDQGTGMTMDIVKNYLLRIGNSYYKSDEFRRKNAYWDNAVAPVSEFGIGLLSCYMIADQIDVITRHHTAVAGEKPIWISMTEHDDFGYQRETDWFQEKELGRHGTIVKLYLKEKFIPMATGYIPEEPGDAAFLLDRYDPQKDGELAPEAMAYLERFENTLYHRVQQFVHIPEAGIPVWIQGTNRRVRLLWADEWYDLIGRIPTLMEHGFELDWLLGKIEQRVVWRYLFWEKMKPSELYQILKAGEASFVTYPCVAPGGATGASAQAILRLPTAVQEGTIMELLSCVKDAHIRNDGVYVDGMPIRQGGWGGAIRYDFRGAVRPRLTVDRGELREVPEAVLALRESLEEQLRQKLAETIRQHVDQYPAVQTPEFWGFLVEHLGERFSKTLVKELLRDLATDVMGGYQVGGACLRDWFHGACLSLQADAQRTVTGFMDCVLVERLFRAESARILDDRLELRMGGDRELNAEERRYLEQDMPGNAFQICVSGWPEVYADYDAVGAYPGLIPERTWLRLRAKNRINDKLAYSGGWSPAVQDSMRLSRPEWQDVLLFLQEPPEGHRLHTSSHMVWFLEEGSRRYVEYVFVAPGELTAEEESELAWYSHIPDYARGVREGWSILFYNYKGGYVIAPGIQKREDMLKLLPREALEHDDGLEYYFTDGTFAFGRKPPGAV